MPARNMASAHIRANHSSRRSDEKTRVGACKCLNLSIRFYRTGFSHILWIIECLCTFVETCSHPCVYPFCSSTLSTSAEPCLDWCIFSSQFSAVACLVQPDCITQLQLHICIQCTHTHTDTHEHWLHPPIPRPCSFPAASLSEEMQQAAKPLFFKNQQHFVIIQHHFFFQQPKKNTLNVNIKKNKG